MNAVVETQSEPKLKLDLGCGPHKREGFLGIDQYPMQGVDAVTNLSAADRWAFSTDSLGGLALSHDDPRGTFYLPDNSVSEVHCSHFLEHLTAQQRVHFMNELHRVLVPGGTATIVTPHWASNRAYGDFTHQWPPVSEMFYYYISREWRKANAPHTDAEWNAEGYECDFGATWGYGMHGEIVKRNLEYQQYAMAWYKEACQDLHATLTARK